MICRHRIAFRRPAKPASSAPTVDGRRFASSPSHCLFLCHAPPLPWRICTIDPSRPSRKSNSSLPRPSYRRCIPALCAPAPATALLPSPRAHLVRFWASWALPLTLSPESLLFPPPDNSPFAPAFSRRSSRVEGNPSISLCYATHQARSIIVARHNHYHRSR